MSEKLRVYLAGPISGCTEEQKRWWREEVKRRLGHQFEFEDPLDWADDKGIPREISKIEGCDIVLANMWKESIGTTVGIIRANEQGKPVVLIDPNHMNNAILESLVQPEKPVRSLEEACKRLAQLAAELQPLSVCKRDGEEERFSAAKLARSVARAAAEAGVPDPSFEELIAKPTIADLRRKGEGRARPGQVGWVTTQEIRQQIFERLQSLSVDPQLTADLRDRAKRVLEAWREKERLKKGEEAIRDAEQRVRQAEEETARWKQLFLSLRDKGLPAVEEAPPEGPVDLVQFGSVEQVLDRFAKKWSGFVLIHDEARATAKRLRPPLTSKEREQLFELLEQLGEFARDRALAAAEGTPPPTFEERFGDRYAATESAETKERYRREFREHEGRKYLGLQHLKARVESSERLRVYFDQLPSGRFLVGWIGHRKIFSHDG